MLRRKANCNPTLALLHLILIIKLGLASRVSNCCTQNHVDIGHYMYQTGGGRSPKTTGKVKRIARKIQSRESPDYLAEHDDPNDPSYLLTMRQRHGNSTNFHSSDTVSKKGSTTLLGFSPLTAPALLKTTTTLCRSELPLLVISSQSDLSPHGQGSPFS